MTAKKNFKSEYFPPIESICSFDNKINDVKKRIKDASTIEETIKGNSIPTIGAYFFYDIKLKKIVYVGISRKIKSRLQQHVNHKSSSSASLAYLMAKNDEANKNQLNDIKSKFEDEKEFREKYQSIIKEFRVGFVEFNNNFELALFEIYAAIKLQSYWNSFKTH